MIVFYMYIMYRDGFGLIKCTLGNSHNNIFSTIHSISLFKLVEFFIIESFVRYNKLCLYFCLIFSVRQFYVQFVNFQNSFHSEVKIRKTSYQYQ